MAFSVTLSDKGNAGELKAKVVNWYLMYVSLMLLKFLLVRFLIKENGCMKDFIIMAA